ncbi:uncharacterized protein LAJ45_01787 [Morchella importuna]|uniref:uncharacterized protein n=1 Tax=Morchella importuna TaxID=1174673 RepID=UPI001E8E5DC9|nr:uncharacterized protein LAJ45_01787 [Morchella importuna]KAH8154020.1 hypothetical protein LAJ45_01787 [Morchella importuna]
MGIGGETSASCMLRATTATTGPRGTQMANANACQLDASPSKPQPQPNNMPPGRTLTRRRRRRKKEINQKRRRASAVLFCSVPDRETPLRRHTYFAPPQRRLSLPGEGSEQQQC